MRAAAAHAVAGFPQSPGRRREATPARWRRWRPAVRANRELVGTLVAAVAEAGPGVGGGDAVEGGAERLVQGVLVPRRDAAQLGLDLGPRRLDRAQVGRVGRQVAVG